MTCSRCGHEAVCLARLREAREVWAETRGLSAQVRDCYLCEDHLADARRQDLVVSYFPVGNRKEEPCPTKETR